MIELLIISLLLLVLSGILNLWLIWQKVKINEILLKNEKEIYVLKESSKDLINKNNKLLQEIKDKEEKFDKQYAELFEKYTKSMHNSAEYQTKVAEYEGQLGKLKFLENEIDNNQKLLEGKKVELANLSSTAAEILLNEQTKLAHIKELELSIKEAERRNSEVENKYDDLMAAIDLVKKELDNLTHLKNSVLAIEEGNGHQWSFTLTDEKKRFVTLIETLIHEYGAAIPELRTGLAKIEWSNVWLPQVQQLCSREGLDGRGGIYKLTSKTDERICYIGQAVNIKDRWYTHIKKMVGVEARGSERLYEYRPDELTWEVVEFKEGNLDSDEKYWIDYYKCREIGLNKKR